MITAPDFQAYYDSTPANQPIQITSPCIGNSSGNGWNTGVGLQFQLSNVTSYTEFTNLFDYWRIDQVDVEIDCLKNSAGVGVMDAPTGYRNNGSQLMPSVLWAPDYDDATPPIGASELAERQGTRSWTFRGDGKPLKFSIKPRANMLGYKTGGTTVAYTVAQGGVWMDTLNADSVYYGVKLWFSDMYASTVASNTVGESTFRIKLNYHLSFRDPK